LTPARGAGHTVYVGSRDEGRGKDAVADIGDDGPNGGFFSWDGSAVPW
jgi:hypothetical protein